MCPTRVGCYLMLVTVIHLGTLSFCLFAQAPPTQQAQQSPSRQGQSSAGATSNRTLSGDDTPVELPSSRATQRARLVSQLRRLRRTEATIGRRHPAYADIQVQITTIEEQIAALEAKSEGSDRARRRPTPRGAAVHNKLPAFPGAVGFGAIATGGRGGDVYHVTNLRDYGRGEPAIVGSFRHAVESTNGPRTIVFDTGGNIALKRTLTLSEDDLTIAGQSAPGDGITIWGYGVKIVRSTNIIIRGLRFRVGDFNLRANNGKPSKGNGDLRGDQADPLEIGWSDRIIIDHVSATWGIDETLTSWLSTNITIQNSIIAESLNDSYHDKGLHGYGALIQGEMTEQLRASNTGGVSYYGNLFTKQYRRSPAYNNRTDLEIVNNVVYDWGKQAGHTDQGGKLDSRINYIGNYVIAGADTKFEIKQIAYDEYLGTDSQFYHRGTYVDADLDKAHNGNAVGDEAFVYFESPFESKPFDFPIQKSGRALAAPEAYKRVVATAGAYLQRDYHDQRIIDEMVNRTGRILGSQDELVALYGIADPIVSLDPGIAPADGDRDGMPDRWETVNGLDPTDAADRNGTALSGDGYTNVEVYLNGLFLRQPLSRR